MSWRPHNETPEDLGREEAARARVEKSWACSVIKLSEQLYGLDWMLFRGRDLIGVGEFKHRSVKYDTLHISAMKWARGRQLSRFADAPFYIFVQWPELELHYCKSDEMFDPVRPCVIFNSRGQPGDMEPGIEIPSSNFYEVCPRSMPGRRFAA